MAMKFNETVLSNGLRLIIVPMADNPSVTVLILARVGSEYETKELSGISHFLEHTVFKGTTKRPKSIDISRELDSLGANYNAFTTQEFTGYYVKAASQHLDRIIDIIADIYTQPRFESAEIEKEKGVVVEEIKMYHDLPQQHVQDLLLELVYGDQPAGWNVAGTEATVRSFTAGNLSEYRQRFYTAEASTVVVAGSFDESLIEQKIAQAFASIPRGSVSNKATVDDSQDGPRIRLEYRETDQCHIALGLRTFSVLDCRIPAMSVLSALLGGGMSSRLFSKMREELGICYYIKAGQNSATDHGLLVISAGLDNQRIEEGLEGIMAECRRLKEETVSESELQKVKDQIGGTILLELETSEARAEFLGIEQVLKNRIEKPEEILARINLVSALHIRKLANEIFREDRLSLALIGRVKDEDVVRKYLKF